MLWSDLVIAADNISGVDPKYGMPCREASKILDLEAIRLKVSSNPEDQSLKIIPLIKKYRPWKSTDPKDKIYALLGLSAGFSHRIVSDYSKRVNVLLWETAVSIIRKTRKFNSLCHSQDRDPRALSSWVPDWSVPLVRPIILDGEDDHIFDIEDGEILPFDLAFKTTGDTEARVAFSEDMRTLQAEGFIFDEVGQTSQVITLRCSYIEILWILAQFQHTVLSEWQIMHPYWSPDGLKSAFWQSVFAGRTTYGSDENKIDELKDHSSWFPHIPPHWEPRPSSQLTSLENRSVRDWGKGLYDLCDGPFDVIDTYDPFKQYRPEYWHYRSFRPSLQPKYITNRQLFVTKKGYVGVGPPGIKMGDCVVLMVGGDVPFMLRSVGAVQNENELLGDCHVHGIMEGQAYDTWLEGDRAASIFWYCVSTHAEAHLREWLTTERLCLQHSNFQHIFCQYSNKAVILRNKLDTGS